MHVEMYFDFCCPFAYLASTRIESLCADAGAQLTWRPILLGGVFRDIGAGAGPLSKRSPPKAHHNRLDIHRWAAYRDVPLAFPSGHPIRTVRALRALLALPEPRWPAAIHELYRTYWERDEDVSTPAVVDAALARAGFDDGERARALAANDDPAIKDDLRRRTDEAVARGVFGVPTMFVSRTPDEPAQMFWGQDRLHLVRAALAGWRPDSGQPPAPEARADAERYLRSAADPEAGERAPGGAERPTVQLWYDFSSPFSYLGAAQIEAVAARGGADVVWRPMLLGAVFQRLGIHDVPLFAMPASKRDYMRRDLEVSAAYGGVPFRFASRFPMRTVTALRMALLAGDRIADLSHALFRALWVDDRDINDPATLADIATAHGFDGADMVARTQDPAVKQQLIDNTAEAADRGVFGAPTAIVTDPAGDRLFWGQDRLPLVEAALGGRLPAVEVAMGGRRPAVAVDAVDDA